MEKPPAQATATTAKRAVSSSPVAAKLLEDFIKDQLLAMQARTASIRASLALILFRELRHPNPKRNPWRKRPLLPTLRVSVSDQPNLDGDERRIAAQNEPPYGSPEYLTNPRPAPKVPPKNVGDTSLLYPDRKPRIPAPPTSLDAISDPGYITFPRDAPIAPGSILRKISQESLNIAESFKGDRAANSTLAQRDRDQETSRLRNAESSEAMKYKLAAQGRFDGETEKEYATRLVAANFRDQGIPDPEGEAKARVAKLNLDDTVLPKPDSNTRDDGGPSGT